MNSILYCHPCIDLLNTSQDLSHHLTPQIPTSNPSHQNTKWTIQVPDYIHLWSINKHLNHQEANPTAKSLLSSSTYGLSIWLDFWYAGGFLSYLTILDIPQYSVFTW